VNRTRILAAVVLAGLPAASLFAAAPARYETGSDGTTIVGNTAYNNGDATDPSNDDGIQCGVGCLVRRNLVRVNRGFGLRLGAGSAHGENVVTGNTAGTISGGVAASTPAQNYCDGPSAPQCP